MSKKQSPSSVTYRHIRLPWLGNSASVTAAIKMSPASADRALVAFSFCSPQEHGFNKRKGRAIARSRLEKRGIEVTLKDDENPKKAMERGLVEAVIQRFNASGGNDSAARRFQYGTDHWLPSWFARALEIPWLGLNLHDPNTDWAQEAVNSVITKCGLEYARHRAHVETENGKKKKEG